MLCYSRLMALKRMGIVQNYEVVCVLLYYIREIVLVYIFFIAIV